MCPDKETNRLYTSRHVVFNELHFPYLENFKTPPSFVDIENYVQPFFPSIPLSVIDTKTLSTFPKRFLFVSHTKTLSTSLKMSLSMSHSGHCLESVPLT